MSRERGKIGEVVGALWRDIGGNWDRLSHDLGLVLVGPGQQLDVAETVAMQQLFIEDLQRFSVAVQRFAAARRAAGEVPP